MTPKEAEAYTRARWKDVQFHESAYAATVYRPDEDTIETIHGIGSGGTAAQAWLAAAEFTKQREEEIRQKRIEVTTQRTRAMMLEAKVQGSIAFGKSDEAAVAATELCVESRILAILESQLAALLVGMKETP